MAKRIPNVRVVCLLLGSLLASACGDSPTRSTTPAPSAPTSRLASDYIDELLGIMETNSLNRAKIDWAGFRAQVVQRAQGAQTVFDLKGAIAVALGLLGDRHSFYQGASGTGMVPNPNGPSCFAAGFVAPTIPDDIGYVRVRAFSGTPAAGIAFADEIEDQIRSRDASGLAGWIVDVRGNTGGNMWPMIAGVGSVLGEGVVGYFVPPAGAPIRWSYRHGQAFSGDVEMSGTSAPYSLIVSSPRVAVLADNGVVSSGEAVVVAFRARPNTRSFGASTCGLSTANQAFSLSDGAVLVLTVAVMADRALAAYGGPIVPDEALSGDAEVVARAIAWLRGQPR